MSRLSSRQVWLTGAGGLIGNYLVRTASKFAPQFRVRALTRQDLDLEDFAAVREAFRRELPAMVIHCAMHTYRAATVDDWREFLGVTSRRHDHMSKYPVKAADAKHPIMKDFPATWIIRFMKKLALSGVIKIDTGCSNTP